MHDHGDGKLYAPHYRITIKVTWTLHKFIHVDFLDILASNKHSCILLIERECWRTQMACLNHWCTYEFMQNTIFFWVESYYRGHRGLNEIQVKILYTMKWEYFLSIYKCYILLFFGYFSTSDAMIKQPGVTIYAYPRCCFNLPRVLLWLFTVLQMGTQSTRYKWTPMQREAVVHIGKISFSSKGNELY